MVTLNSTVSLPYSMQDPSPDVVQAMLLSWLDLDAPRRMLAAPRSDPKQENQEIEE